MIDGIASGESMRRKPRGGDETVDGAARKEASVESHGAGGILGAMTFDLICRTAVYVTRTHGGVGGEAP